MKKVLGYAALVLAAAVTMGSAAGCGKAAEVATEAAIEKSASSDGQQVNVDLSGGKMVVKSEDGEMEVTSDGSGKMVVKNEEGTFEMKSEGDSFEMKSEDGATTMSTGAGTKVPEAFPKDVPIYDGLVLQQALANAEEKTYSVGGITQDGVDKVAAFYKEKLGAEGWSEQSTLSQPGAQYMTYAKDTRTVMVAANKSSEGTSVSITAITGQAAAE